MRERPRHRVGAHVDVHRKAGIDDHTDRTTDSQRRRARRSKRRITLWLTPETMATLQACGAGAARVPLCELAERFIRTGLKDSSARQLESAAMPALADAVRTLLDEHAHQAEDRLARLLTRAILASDTTRRLVYAHMTKQWGADLVRPVHASARTAAINALKEKGWAASLVPDVEEPPL